MVPSKKTTAPKWIPHDLYWKLLPYFVQPVYNILSGWRKERLLRKQVLMLFFPPIWHFCFQSIFQRLVDASIAWLLRSSVMRWYQITVSIGFIYFWVRIRACMTLEVIQKLSLTLRAFRLVRLEHFSIPYVHSSTIHHPLLNTHQNTTSGNRAVSDFSIRLPGTPLKITEREVSFHP